MIKCDVRDTPNVMKNATLWMGNDTVGAVDINDTQATQDAGCEYQIELGNRTMSGH